MSTERIDFIVKNPLLRSALVRAIFDGVMGDRRNQNGAAAPVLCHLAKSDRDLIDQKVETILSLFSRMSPRFKFWQSLSACLSDVTDPTDVEIICGSVMPFCSPPTLSLDKDLFYFLTVCLSPPLADEAARRLVSSFAELDARFREDLFGNFDGVLLRGYGQFDEILLNAAGGSYFSSLQAPEVVEVRTLAYNALFAYRTAHKLFN